MARIRYLKPDFFFDDGLSNLKFEHRLAFAGLWCYADRRGRLEDCPKKLKALIFPYDNTNMDSILNRLTEKPFIIRYEVDSRKYIQIINFEKHQRPHHTEKESIIPKPDESLTVKNTLKDGEKKEGMEKGMEKGMGMEKGSVLRTRFAPPTQQEVISFFNGDSLEGERFFDFYKSKDWFVGKNKMKDWRAAARNWMRNSKNFNTSKKIRGVDEIKDTAMEIMEELHK